MSLELSKLNAKNIFDFLKETDLKSLPKEDLVSLRTKVKDFQSLWDIKNNIYKVNVINSLYGIIDEEHSPIHNPDIAESVTGSGQLCIGGVSNYLDKKLKPEGTQIFYNDTDSVFIKCGNIPKIDDSKELVEAIRGYANKSIVPGITEFFNDLGKKFNVKNRIKMDVESFCDQLIMQTPKKYIGRLILNKGMFHDKSEFKFKTKGVSSVRRDTPMWVREKIKKCFPILFDQDNEAMIDYIESCKEEFMKLPVEKIGKPTSVQDVDKYATLPKGTPRPVKSAIAYNKFLDDYNLTSTNRKIYNGTKILFWYLNKDAALKIGLNSIAWNRNDKMPAELRELLETGIDREVMWEKTFVAPVRDIIGVADWSFVRVNNALNDL